MRIKRRYQRVVSTAPLPTRETTTTTMATAIQMQGSSTLRDA
jgi:hypothetical protein